MQPWLENSLLFLVDQFYAVLPQARPDAESLRNCKLVSHRGERDGKTVKENTFAAFDPILEHGIWGIELDVRWTKDLVPVVIHDADGQRVYGNPFVIAENTWEACQKALPEVPSLQALVDRYGKRCHLMIELKQEPYPNPEKQKLLLKQILSSLSPEEDFHIIALDYELFDYVDFLPKKALLPVSTVNAKAFSDYALKHGLGGVTGHFLFMDGHKVIEHHKVGQQIGSGFSNSKNVLFREINKDMDWVFSNQALAMHRIIQRSLKNN